MTTENAAVPTAGALPPVPPVAPGGRGTWRVIWEVLLVAMAVGLPAITLVTEWITHICGETFIDPIPTPFHLLLVALVPVANLLVWLSLRRGWNWGGKRLGLLTGAALAISLCYAILYLPLAPFALMALLVGTWYFGLGLIGLLPLSPLLSYIAALVLRRRLILAREPAGARTVPGIRIGFFVSLVVLLAACSVEIVTLSGLRLAISENPDNRSRGIAVLRRMGREEMVLRFCHGGKSFYDQFLMQWILDDKPMDSAKARLLYYRMTGNDARHVRPRSGLGGLLGRGRWQEEDFIWDSQQGGAVVGGILKGLFLDSSRMDGTLDGDTGVGYMEWTLVFRNESDFRQREARATVALPAGAVVSRLTLWVNGEEREAAFGGRSQVRAAYEKVVRARRDPVLVTTCGPDRLLVQCFPIEPNGGTMKVRLGLTVPLQPAEKQGLWTLNLPVFLERNFKFSPEKSHDVWLESRSALKPLPDSKEATLTCSTGSEGTWTARGRLEDVQLWGSEAGLIVQGQGDGSAWCGDALGQPGVVRQVLTETVSEKPASVVLVVDGSVSMEKHAAGVARALRGSFPKKVRLGVVTVGDSPGKMPAMEAGSAVRAAGGVESFRYEGGRCGVRALEEAWDALAGEPGPSVLVWVHGSQPVPMDSPDGLLQRMERQAGRVRLISLQVEPGTDLVSAELEKAVGVTMLPPSRDPARSLERLFRGWWPDVKRLKAVRTREPGKPDQPPGAKASDHLARIWAHEEVARLLSTGNPPDAGAATAIAVRYHLVTPVSGAVVLETAQQFKEAGLEPVPSDTVPIVPEPEFWLMAVVALGAVWFLWRRRRAEALAKP